MTTANRTTESETGVELEQKRMSEERFHKLIEAMHCFTHIFTDEISWTDEDKAYAISRLCRELYSTSLCYQEVPFGVQMQSGIQLIKASLLMGLTSYTPYIHVDDDCDEAIGGVRFDTYESKQEFKELHGE